MIDAFGEGLSLEPEPAVSISSPSLSDHQKTDNVGLRYGAWRACSGKLKKTLEEQCGEQLYNQSRGNVPLFVQGTPGERRPLLYDHTQYRRVLHE